MKKLFSFGRSTPPPPPPPQKAPLKHAAAAPPKSLEPAPTIVGRWKEPKGEGVTEFFADGTLKEKPAAHEQIKGRYSIEGSTLIVNLEGATEPLRLRFALQEGALILTEPDGQSTRYEHA